MKKPNRLLWRRGHHLLTVSSVSAGNPHWMSSVTARAQINGLQDNRQMKIMVEQMDLSCTGITTDDLMFGH